MADEEQLRILKQGPAAWNAWRRDQGSTRPDLRKANLSRAILSGAELTRAQLDRAVLSGADLSGAYLSEANLSETNLSNADLSGAYLVKASLMRAILKGANLSEANLIGANLHGTNLQGANFTRAILNGVDLSKANLSEASLLKASLPGAILSGAFLGGTDLSEVRFDDTVIANVDLSGCEGLGTIHHEGPSSIDIRTLRRSSPLPLAFLRGVGLPDALIDYLPSLLSRAILYSCFISFSSTDEDFARRLHADLQDKGVRCWFAPEDMKIGDEILDTLDKAIQLRDKLLLVLSEASIASKWVKDEVTKAFDEERHRGSLMLFPVRVDDAVMETKEAWASKLRRSRNIGDFRAWKDHDAYQKALQRVLRDLQIDTAPDVA